MKSLPTAPVLGTALAVTDYQGAVEQCMAWAGSMEGTFCVAAANTHLVALARHDPLFGRAMGAFELILPDGMPLIWAINQTLSPGLKDRVYGPTFMLRCLEATQGQAWSHLFIGGDEPLLDSLCQKLLERFPRLRIAGRHSPRFGTWSKLDDDLILEQISASGAQFVWIGLGCPKQELWLAQNRPRLPAGVYCAVGAAFAFHAGAVKQAPGWMQRHGLEWAFRLLMEPRRLFRRYLVFNTLFVFYLVRDRLLGRCSAARDL
jgi:N-acetylglucosaminyldiphosphoundecaprenol N-acetyl-beta-D-mannosaminyltransferase